YTGVAESSDGRNVTVELVSGALKPARTNERVAVEEQVGGGVGDVAIRNGIGPLRSPRRGIRPRGIAAAHGGGQVRAGLQQKNTAKAPPAADRIGNRIPPAAEVPPFAERQFEYRCCDRTVTADRPHVAAVAAPAEGVGHTSPAGLAGEPAGS